MSLSWGSLVSAAKGAYAKVKSVVKSVVNTVSSCIKSVTKSIQKIGTAAVSKLSSAINGTKACLKSVKNAAGNKLNNLRNAIIAATGTVNYTADMPPVGIKQTDPSNKTEIYNPNKLYKVGDKVKKWVNGKWVYGTMEVAYISTGGSVQLKFVPDANADNKVNSKNSTTNKKGPSLKDAVYMANYSYGKYKKGDKTPSGEWELDRSIDDDNLHICIFIKVNKDGKKEYAFVNKGTTPTNKQDWIEDVEQLFGKSKDMDKSIAYAEEFKRRHPNDYVVFIGHSKGGAEATANAVVTNSDAIVFNPASVNLGAYRVDTSEYKGNVTNYVVKGDILNDTEGQIIKPVGNTVYLPEQEKNIWIKGNEMSFGPFSGVFKFYAGVKNHINIAEAVDEYEEQKEK